MFIPYPFIRFFLSAETSITNNGEVLWDILHVLNIRRIKCVYIYGNIQTTPFTY